MSTETSVFQEIKREFEERSGLKGIQDEAAR